ncbi:TetR/AcrR family transcriptional regulator [Haloferax namakaokahaiae]|uniref:TetR/AcrR family transcriptional regulator n=1 Tax=Haloferax namakaokahaiae TaxID=1748331 RepID=A0ABD5ZBG2_9EURY
MSAESPSDQSVPDEVHETLMEATYRALCAEGYANLTMQRIADEAGKSKSLLHYHYGTKHDLLLAFLRHLMERFDAKVDATEGDAPDERLRYLLDKMVPNDGGDGDDDEYDTFGLALMELRTQAPYDEAYREQIAKNERVIRERISAIIRDGIERGVFREVDPDRMTALLFAALDGARLQRVVLSEATDDESAIHPRDVPTEVRTAIDKFVLSDLLTEDR